MNHFAAAPEVIPLQQAYLFQASPADGTLKNMLSRWARDSRMSLSYLHSNDYTLYAPVADIHTTNLQAAVSALTDAYAQQGVSITADGSQIVVRAATAASAELED
ncbi:TcpQ domain-containing protein [Marilutibacter alkalisoli]|uniref:TcpQ domain-containing protein n=1 Tax=Marilutibacter alkalisoli TaxID=2591633 RepID=UPI001FCA07E1|nr:TcpQ domain-containing protein [Lysobacter alkalisoli]